MMLIPRFVIKWMLGIASIAVMFAFFYTLASFKEFIVPAIVLISLAGCSYMVIDTIGEFVLNRLERKESFREILDRFYGEEL